MKRWGKEIVGRAHPVIFGRGLGAAAILPPSVVSTIAQVITNTENAKPSLNNPGNLMYAGQAGATGTPGSLATFDNLADGQAALQNQIQLYAGRGYTIQDMMNVYAPGSIPGNNPVAYAGYVSSALGVTPDTPLTDLSGGAFAPSSPVESLDFVTQAENLASGLDFTDPMTIGVTVIAGLGLFFLARMV